MILTRDGLREVLLCTLIFGGGGIASAWAAATASPLWWIAAVPLLGVWLFTLAFFRDPHRPIPAGAGLLVSPADGKVTEITTLEYHERIGGPALRVGIFLSVFNVHVNRSPCAGRVVRTDYCPGDFLDARHPECGIRNEAMDILIDPEGTIPGPLMVRQIAGLIARRIVCRVQPGDELRRGQRIGMIKFGSRTELIVPANAGIEAAVQVGQSVKGGETVLMRVTTVQAGGGPEEEIAAARRT